MYGTYMYGIYTVSTCTEKSSGELAIDYASIIQNEIHSPLALALLCFMLLDLRLFSIFNLMFFFFWLSSCFLCYTMKVIKCHG